MHTGPIQWIKAKFNVTMERRLGPIRNPFDVAMFQGVDVAIINVRRIILVVASRTLAQSDHLPIYKSSYDLYLYLEQVVHGFSRYHKRWALTCGMLPGGP